MCFNRFIYTLFFRLHIYIICFGFFSGLRGCCCERWWWFSDLQSQSDALLGGGLAMGEKSVALSVQLFSFLRCDLRALRHLRDLLHVQYITRCEPIRLRRCCLAVGFWWGTGLRTRFPSIGSALPDGGGCLQYSPSSDRRRRVLGPQPRTLGWLSIAGISKSDGFHSANQVLFEVLQRIVNGFATVRGSSGSIETGFVAAIFGREIQLAAGIAGVGWWLFGGFHFAQDRRLRIAHEKRSGLFRVFGRDRLI